MAIVPCGINETATRFEFFYRQLPHVGHCVRLSRGSSRHCCPDPHCQPPHCCCARHGSWDHALELAKAWISRPGVAKGSTDESSEVRINPNEFRPELE